VTAGLDRWFAAQDPAQWAAAKEPLPFMPMMALFIYTRVLLQRADLAGLTTQAELLQHVADQFARPLFWRRQLQVRMHQLFVLQALQRKEEARDLLAILLAEAQGELHRFTFIEARSRLAPLLAELARTDPWAADVWAACRRYGVDDAAEPPRQPLVEPLSERELEVTALLAEGLTNKEIGVRLHLSPNTVRVHTSNIYGKLGVNGRLQAAQKAAELGLIVP
jgi:ATP/maltotriose-dependent transcriptional regulator MalT